MNTLSGMQPFCRVFKDHGGQQITYQRKQGLDHLHANMDHHFGIIPKLLLACGREIAASAPVHVKV